MGVPIGTRFGPYEILAPLGAGGMGEVYRAKDTRLDRTVAIKIISAALGDRPDLRQRFEREARAVAALNHPHICTLHDIGHCDGLDFLVMEYVEGETLTARLAKGPLPLAQAIHCAAEIASALDTAHRAGIVHRDLKPGNVMLTPAGAKLLDFGLAKSMTSISAAGAAAGPTLPAPAQLTTPGTILGTVPYMAPEQLEGKDTDARTDIFAFGAVLFEMLTGKKAFDGSSPASLIAAILDQDPPRVLSLLASVPPSIDRIVQACLAKDPDDRWQTARDLHRELKWIADTDAATISTPPASGTNIRERIAWIATAVAMLAVVVLAISTSRRGLPELPVTRFAFTLGEGQKFRRIYPQLTALSPDGTQMVYVANNQVYLRSMSNLEARPIPGTQGSQPPFNPVFSPDGKSIVFYSEADRVLKKIVVTGGAAFTICATDMAPLGISWDYSGIDFGQGSKGIVRVSANGGTPEVLITVKAGEVAHGPQILLAGEVVLFTVATGAFDEAWDKAQIVVQSLKSGERRTLLSGGSDGRYLPSGHIVYALADVLYAVPFDVRRLAVTGGPVPIVEGVGRPAGEISGGAHFSVSNTGSLAYVPGPAIFPSSQLDIALVDRNAAIQPLRLPPGPYKYPRLCPDGKRLAFSSDNGKEAIIWIYDLAGTTSVRRLTQAGHNRFPVWSADGERVAFQSDRDGDFGIFQQRADGMGPAERLTKPEQGTEHVPESWSPDGKTLLIDVARGSSHSVATLALDGRKVTPFGGIESSGPPSSIFSPDGRWVAYSAYVVGTPDFEVFVQPFPSTRATYQIGYGAHPMWSADGKELLFMRPGQYASVTISTQPTFTFGKPTTGLRPFIDRGPASERNADITHDGAHFIGVIDTTRKSPLEAEAIFAEAGGSAAPQIQVVLNWFEELKRLVPAK